MGSASLEADALESTCVVSTQALAITGDGLHSQCPAVPVPTAFPCQQAVDGEEAQTGAPVLEPGKAARRRLRCGYGYLSSPLCGRREPCDLLFAAMAQGGHTPSSSHTMCKIEAEILRKPSDLDFNNWRKVPRVCCHNCQAPSSRLLLQ